MDENGKKSTATRLGRLQLSLFRAQASAVCLPCARGVSYLRTACLSRGLLSPTVQATVVSVNDMSSTRLNANDRFECVSALELACRDLVA